MKKIGMMLAGVLLASGIEAQAASAYEAGHKFCTLGHGLTPGTPDYNACLVDYMGAMEGKEAPDIDAPVPGSVVREPKNTTERFFDDLYEHQRQRAIENVTPGRTTCRKIGDAVFCTER